MSRLSSDSEYLAWRAAELVRAPPMGIRPWPDGGHAIVEILNRASRYADDHGAFHLVFMDGIRNLLSDTEDVLFSRYAEHARLAEGRVMADKTTQRDHLTHVSQVFLLGWLLLNGTHVFTQARAECQPYGWQLDPAARFERLNRCWLFAGLLHDSAYSIEVARDAARQDLRTAAVFGDFFEIGAAGELLDAQLKADLEAVWRWRCEHVVRGTREEIDQSIRTALGYRDHAAAMGAKLFSESKKLRAQETGDLPDILDAASAAIASHNFQYFAKDFPNSDWFRLDFEQEPVAALLHLADELQEWNRDRTDEALSRMLRTQNWFASTEVTRLDFDSAAGLCVDVAVLHRLHPDDRPRKPRVVRDKERDVASAARRLRLLFEPRSEDPDFRLHLRVRHTVDDQHCGNDLTVAWPRAKGTQVGIAKEDVESLPLGLEEARAVIDGEVVARMGADGEVSLVNEPRSFVIVGEGGAGKSTLLRALVHSTHLPVVYVEELPGHAADLLPPRSRGEEDGESIVVVDHLDRLEEAELGGFWLDQLRDLSGAPGVRIVGACRPEPWARFVQGALGGASGGFRHAILEGPVAAFAGGRVDEEGRVRALGIAAQMVRPTHDDLYRLGRLALSWKMRRNGAVDPESLPVVHFGTERKPVLRQTAHGGACFVHDVVQDYLAAYALAANLLDAGSDVVALRAIARSLPELPRDVARLLFDLLAEAVPTLSGPKRRRAAVALSRALLLEGNLRFWFWHLERYGSIRNAMTGFRDAHRASPAVRACASALLAHAALAQAEHGTLERGLPEGAADIVDDFAMALEALDDAAREDAVGPVEAEQLCVFVLDHVMKLLSRGHHAQADEAVELTRRFLGRLPREGDAAIGTPAWVRSILAPLADARGVRAIVEEAMRVDPEIERWTTRPCDGEWARVSRDIPLAHFAAHVAGTINYFVKVDPTCQDLGYRAIEWQQRSRARLERAARKIAEADGVESRAVRSDILANVAARESFQINTWLAMWRPDLDRAQARRIARGILGAHTRQEEAWRIARADLLPGERVSVLYHTLLPELQVGRVFEWALMEKKVPDVERVRKKLLKNAESALHEWPSEGERNPTIRARRDTVEGFYEYLADDLCQLATMLRELAGALRMERGL